VVATAKEGGLRVHDVASREIQALPATPAPRGDGVDGRYNNVDIANDIALRCVALRWRRVDLAVVSDRYNDLRQAPPHPEVLTQIKIPNVYQRPWTEQLVGRAQEQACSALHEGGHEGAHRGAGELGVGAGDGGGHLVGSVRGGELVGQDVDEARDGGLFAGPVVMRWRWRASGDLVGHIFPRRNGAERLEIYVTGVPAADRSLGADRDEEASTGEAHRRNRA
jgi:hypothetical protein